MLITNCKYFIFIFYITRSALSEETSVLSRDENDYMSISNEVSFSNDDSVSNDDRAGCSVSVDSLSKNVPVIITKAAIAIPDPTGYLTFAYDQELTVACPGNELMHPLTSERPERATLLCSSGENFSSSNWLPGIFNLSSISCSCHPRISYVASSYCEVSSESRILVGLPALGTTYSIFTACFTEIRGKTEMVIYNMNPESNVTQTIESEPPYQQGAFFPGLDMSKLYTMKSQEEALETILGKFMASEYLSAANYLIPKQLADSNQFVFMNTKRATFAYVNTAPQWLTVNNGNWRILEESLRHRIAEKGSRTTIYSGTFGVLMLPNEFGVPKSIYLNSTSSKVPVPLFFYKVVSEPSTKKATAFVTINNPYISSYEAEKLVFCTDFCAGSNAFRWLEWNTTNNLAGHSFCCELAEFQKNVTNLPTITTVGLFS